MSNSLGYLYRISTFGESHGGAVGVLIDGCPPGHRISLEKVQHFLNRRKPGQSQLSSPRNEQDILECLSGLENGISLGSPITIIVRNKDAKKSHYKDMQEVYRPSHADFTTDLKYGIRAQSGGGRASARETIGRVAGAAVAEQVLANLVPELRVLAYVESVKDVKAHVPDPMLLTRDMIDSHPLRCPDAASREEMSKIILDAKAKGDSVGGSIRCLCLNPPRGLGSPVFEKLHSEFAKAFMSLPATRAFAIGMGFQAEEMYGSEHNDAFVTQDGAIRTKTNRSGGIQGGISNGELISMRVGFKPVATIFKKQETVNKQGESRQFKPEQGRHDPCVLPRAVPMVESMALLVLMDQYLRQLVVKASMGENSSIKTED